MAINLMKKYAKPINQAYKYETILAGKTSEQFDWKGVNAIISTNIKTEPLQNYNRNTSGNRFGEQKEVQDEQQNMELQWDLSVPLSVDKGNYKEGMEMKTAGVLVHDEMNEQINPEVERLAMNEWAIRAGQYLTITDDDDGLLILRDMMRAEAAMINKRVPKKERFAAVDANLMPYIRTALTSCNDITDKMVLQGLVGRIGTLNILEVPHGDMPLNCHILAWQKKSVYLAKTIMDCNLHKDPPGLSGLRVEFRHRFGAFVDMKYCNGVVAILAASQQATAVTPTTARVLDLNSGDTVYYTLDGSDPRYSKTAVKITSDTTVSSTDAPVGTVIKAVTWNSGKKYPSDVKSAVVAA